ncbi:MAG: ATP-dependent DNA helicase [Hydrogenophilales bacterium]|nr:ATP-dependent DNA helicase [Hydrogenophilales bacterium]
MDLHSLFSASGAFSKHIDHYRPRAQQLEMAEQILSALDRGARLIVEAGTGTGKTLAYLAPLMLHGGKAIISTGTKTLQDQLFHRDIPAVREALGLPIQIALLKGRANYVCPYHLERALSDGRFNSREEVAHLRRIAHFAAVTESGDRMELTDIPENASAWAYATSTRENCLGSECPHHRGCFVLNARKKALEADMVVVNHHLFFADVWLKDEGAGELLPASNAVVFDEAHQLPEIASVFFGESVTTGVLVDLSRDVRQEAAVAATESQDLPRAAAELDTAARDLRISLGAALNRWPAARVLDKPEFREALEKLDGCLAGMTRLLESQAERSEGLGACLQRAQEAAICLARWRQPEAESGMVRWCEATQYSVLLHSTPLDPGEQFAKQLADDPRAWVFTSATLSVRGDFSHYQQRVGLHEAETAQWESPYDYPTQALLYVPGAMPDPNTPGYTEAVVEAAWPVLKASRGGAFLLFTSLRAMNEAHLLICEKMRAEDSEIHLLLQGEKSRSELLSEFRRLGNAVLLGSQSFWEGVDVAGEALSLVVIDRLPFQPPDDPVLNARIDKMRQEGRNPFFDYQLPHAVISLKQGAGWLIRRESDRGVLMICDPRLVDKPYGRRVWQSLPPMRRTRVVEEVIGFFKDTNAYN